VFRDLNNTIDYAYLEGKEEGKAEGKIEMAKAMQDAGAPIDKIVQYTGLSIEDIAKL
jgi:predicted transposase/invertase (TIGR01784 family)